MYQLFYLISRYNSTNLIRYVIAFVCCTSNSCEYGTLSCLYIPA